MTIRRAGTVPSSLERPHTIIGLHRCRSFFARRSGAPWHGHCSWGWLAAARRPNFVDGRATDLASGGRRSGLRTPRRRGDGGTIMLLEYPGGILAWLVVGLISGWLAGLFMRGRGYGMIWDIVIGLIGAFVGGLICSFSCRAWPASGGRSSSPSSAPASSSRSSGLSRHGRPSDGRRNVQEPPATPGASFLPERPAVSKSFPSSLHSTCPQPSADLYLSPPGVLTSSR